MLCLCVLAATAVAQTAPAINLSGSLKIVDATPDTTPVSALSVGLYSPATLAMYRAQPDENGRFELMGILPGRYLLEMGTPARLQSFSIAGKDVSPAAFELHAGEQGPMSIVLSVKTGTLTAGVQGAPDANTKLVAVLAPDDEYLTLHAQFTSPVAGNTVQFLFLPPGNYLLYIADEDFRSALGFEAKLRDALKEKATRVEVVAGVDTRVSANYIDRRTVEEMRRKPASD